VSVRGGERERLEELLVSRTVEGLDPADDAELERLLAASEDADPALYDEAAAWFLVGSVTEHEPLPAEVGQRIVDRLEQEPPRVAPASVVPLQRRARRRWLPASTGWIAAAAALVLALAGWWPELQGTGALDPAAARDQLIATAPDLVRVEWSNTDHPRAQRLDGGYVVWSDTRQQGYMTFRRIPANDPDRHQYQLWVFDAGRSEQYPVDGGVFNAAKDGDDVVIPIHTKLPVKRATLFAVTLEPPGGVVVSDRDPILWIAKPAPDASG